jgi:hypothetical protein
MEKGVATRLGVVVTLGAQLARLRCEESRVVGLVAAVARRALEADGVGQRLRDGLGDIVVTLSTKHDFARGQQRRMIRGVGIVAVQTLPFDGWEVLGSGGCLVGYFVAVEADRGVGGDGGRAGVLMAEVARQVRMHRGA